MGSCFECLVGINNNSNNNNNNNQNGDLEVYSLQNVTVYFDPGFPSSYNSHFHIINGKKELIVERKLIQDLKVQNVNEKWQIKIKIKTPVYCGNLEKVEPNRMILFVLFFPLKQQSIKLDKQLLKLISKLTERKVRGKILKVGKCIQKLKDHDSITKRIYSKQFDAFQYVDGLDAQQCCLNGQGWPSPQVFAYQTQKGGWRQFMSIGKIDFYNHFLSLLPTERHIYEIIREERPCRLYFDLEFPKCKYNSDIRGYELVQKVINATGFFVFKLFGFILTKENFVNLDSSSNEKFSTHLIIHFPNNYLFRNNRECGCFVNQFYEKYKELFQVFDNEGNQTSFIDLGVYTRNRMFRCYSCTKFKKKAVLKPSHVNQFPAKLNSKNGFINFFENTMVAPPDYDTKKYKVIAYTFDHVDKTKKRKAEVVINQTGKNENMNQVVGFSTPFPKYEQKVIQHAMNYGNGVVPIIRKWYITNDETGNQKYLVLEFLRNRFCLRIKRHHKSNNVSYIIDLQKNIFIQKCFDLDCKGFISPPFPL